MPELAAPCPCTAFLSDRFFSAPLGVLDKSMQGLKKGQRVKMPHADFF